MTDRYRTEWDVDAAIDRAVREIMSAEPRPGFSRRVQRRLAAPPTRQWTWARLGPATAVAALALLAAIWLATPQRKPPETTVAQQPPPRVAPQAAPPERRPAPVKPSVRDLPPPRRSRGDFRQPPPGRVEAASIVVGAGPELDRVEQPLDIIQPIHIVPVQTRALGLPEVVIQPLTIERITIPPLSPPR
jgi:hypothetical protein